MSDENRLVVSAVAMTTPPPDLTGELHDRPQTARLWHRIVRAATGVFLLRVAYYGLSFVLSIFLARLLGVAGYGLYSYALAWVLLLTMPAVLGLDQFLVRESAAYHARSEWGLLRGLLRRAHQAVLLASLGLVAVAALVVWATAQARDREFVSVIWIALTLLPLLALTRIWQGAMQGLHRVVLGTLPQTILQPFVLIALLGGSAWFFPSELNASRAMAMTVVATALGCLVGLQLLRRSVPGAVRTAKPHYQTRMWSRSTLPFLLFSGVGIVNAQADTLILGSIKGTAAVGIYGIADRAAEFVQFVLVATSAGMASTLATLHAEGNLRGLQDIVTRAARTALLVTLPIAAVMIGLGYWILLFVYGQNYTRGASALAILSLGQLANVALGPAGMLLLMTRHELDATMALGAGAAANLVLGVLLTPLWGMEGTALAVSASAILSNVLMVIAGFQRLGINATALGTSGIVRLPR